MLGPTWNVLRTTGTTWRWPACGGGGGCAWAGGTSRRTRRRPPSSRRRAPSRRCCPWWGCWEGHLECCREFLLIVYVDRSWQNSSYSENFDPSNVLYIRSVNDLGSLRSVTLSREYLCNCDDCHSIIIHHTVKVLVLWYVWNTLSRRLIGILSL